jgi:hypothetical protein
MPVGDAPAQTWLSSLPGGAWVATRSCPVVEQLLGRVERRQIHLLDRRQHEPREVTRRGSETTGPFSGIDGGGRLGDREKPDRVAT